jgi:hypothetical protein
MPMCHKKCFDKIGALEAMYAARASKNPKRRECRIYHCSQCNAFHLTSQRRDVAAGQVPGASLHLAVTVGARLAAVSTNKAR